jgi:hypothetical protein
MPKTRKKLKTLKQTDGKVRKEDITGKPQLSTLAQLWGEETGLNKYGTIDIETYKAQLKEMNTASLREHAIEVAHVIPGTNRDRLEKRLEAEFSKHVAAFTPIEDNRPKEREPSKEALKIMEETK